MTDRALPPQNGTGGEFRGHPCRPPSLRAVQSSRAATIASPGRACIRCGFAAAERRECRSTWSSQRPCPTASPGGPAVSAKPQFHCASARPHMTRRLIRATSAARSTSSSWQESPPAGAQSAEQSAQTILAGVAKNERLVLGDALDLSGAKFCFNPDAAGKVDEYLLNVARKRRSGEWVV